MAKPAEFIYDQLLVMRCQDGEQAALNELVARWHRRLWLHARNVAGDADGASDIAQESWLAIVRGLTQLQDAAAFRSWAYRIVTRRAVDWIRTRQRRREDERTAAASELRTQAASSESALEAVRQAYDGLAIEDRVILSMHHVDSISTTELSLILDIPRGTVKSRLHHARQRLKANLERTTS